MAYALDFPRSPEPRMTTGKLCEYPVSYRYPEHIAYCDRFVTTELKDYIIDKYDHDFGYRINYMKREDFKIDHLIPLCVGGSNDISNLWPQHKSVYKLTDPLEQLACDKMKVGKLTQKDAVQLIIYAKTNLDQVQKVESYFNSL